MYIQWQDIKVEDTELEAEDIVAEEERQNI